MSFDKLLQQSLLWRGVYFITVLILNIVVSRTLHADGSGWLYFCTNIFTIILLISTLNLESGFTYFASSASIHHNRLAMLGACWALLISLVLVPVIYVYASGSSNIKGLSSTQFTFYAGNFIIGIMLTTYFTVLFYAQRNFFIPNLWLSVSNLVLIMLFFFRINFGLEINAITAVYFLFYTIQGLGLMGLFYIKNKHLGEWKLPIWIDFKRLLHYSFITLAGNVAFYLLYRVDYFFVGKYCSISDLGNYIQASKMGQMLLIIPQIIASAIFPEIASGGASKEVGDSILVLFRVFIQLFAVLLIVIGSLGYWLFPWVFGYTFGKMYLPMLIILPGMLSLSVLVLLSAFFSGKGKIKLNMWGTSLGLLVALIGNWLFVPLFGIYAAAWCSTIAYATYFIYGMYHFKQLHPFDWKRLWHFNISDWRWLFGLILSKQKLTS